MGTDKLSHSNEENPLDHNQATTLLHSENALTLRLAIATSGYKGPHQNKFAPRALHLSPRQDRGVLRRRKPKTARYADFKNTNYNAPRGKTTGNRKLNRLYTAAWAVTNL